MVNVFPQIFGSVQLMICPSAMLSTFPLLHAAFLLLRSEESPPFGPLRWNLNFAIVDQLTRLADSSQDSMWHAFPFPSLCFKDASLLLLSWPSSQLLFLASAFQLASTGRGVFYSCSIMYKSLMILAVQLTIDQLKIWLFEMPGSLKKGGSLVNYYMGNQLWKKSQRPFIANNYDYDAPTDEYG